MNDRDHREPPDADWPPRRRPGSRALGSMSDALGSVSDALARLVPRRRGEGGWYGDGQGTPMSDEELREAFRLAGLTVKPAPLGRSSRRAREEAPPGETDADGPAGETVADGPEAATPAPRSPAAGAAATAGGAAATAGGAAASASPPTTREVPVPAADKASAPFSVPAAAPSPAPSSAWAAAPTGPSAADAPRSPALAPAPGADRSTAPLPEPDPADPIKLPGNLGTTTDDFFRGLVRRIERRP